MTQVVHKVSKKAVIIEADHDQIDSTISLTIALIHRKLSSMADLDAHEVDSGEVYKLSNSLAGLTRARSEHRKLETIRTEAVAQAKGELATLVRQRLTKHPELCERLQEIVAEVETTALDQRQ
ncbi:MAG: hypothetical protein AB7V04_06450 [Desulfomonilaceae bacterium]